MWRKVSYNVVACLSSEAEKRIIFTVEAVKKYYTRERNHLLKMSMDTLRLMKYILNDPRNESTKGELIGFVHAMRSIKDEKTKSFPGAKTKPYLLPRDRCNLK